jgi:uncharacterized protein
MSHIPTVQEMYAAFGAGDIATILSHLAEDIDWEYAITDAGVPWLTRRRGRDQVPGFFQALQAFEFRQFQPKTFLESGAIVVSLIDVDLVHKASGFRITEADEAHLWHFGPDGKVQRFGHKADTHQHWLAWRQGR